jgi:hypothetical protein
VYQQAPVQQVAPQLQPAAYAQPPMQVQPQPVYAQPQPTFVPPQPPPMPVHVPFAQQAAPVQHHVVHAPQQPMVTHVPQQQLVAPTQQMPVVAIQQQHAPAPVAEPAHEADSRRHSRAPKGMGSSLRLDDPSLRDTIARARDERAGLADEYRKLTAPLVDMTGQAPGQHAPVEPGVHQPQFVGHDPNGVALFATPGVPGVHPIEQYPAAAMPRPVIAQPATVDPALQSNAFQHAAPYSPRHHEAQPAPAAAPA